MAADRGPTMCPVFHPTRDEFSQPFCKFVRSVLRRHPGIAMFKVVPPEGWRPRRRPFPRLRDMTIATPIKQHVFGTRGAYQCLLVEQKGLSAEQFQELSETEGHQPPVSNRERGAQPDKTRARSAAASEQTPSDELMERAFWSSVTLSPPLYGADTPQSFFDEKLPYGWNLRHLDGCLLKANEAVPHIPGVTSPMTYFGMWKSFFSWHVEDADLFSINYVHFGAPKVWYCVSPAHRERFERMAQSLFPELHRSCHAFLRHKDILLSPSLLRTYGVEYTQAKQRANEFIVLNAGAYHSGYNLGFNCAEAVNFATEEWLDVGRSVQRCKCSALKDGVRISMRLFGLPDSESDDDSDGDGSDSDEDSGGRSPDRRGSADSSATHEDSSGSDDDSDGDDAGSDSGDDEPVAPAPPPKKRSRSGARRPASGARPAAAAAAAARRGGGTPATGPPRKRARTIPAAPAPRVGPRSTKTARAAAEAARQQRSGRASAEARAKAAKRAPAAKPAAAAATAAAAAAAATAGKATAGVDKAAAVSASLQRAAAAAAAVRARMSAQRRAAPARRGEASSDDGAAGSDEFADSGTAGPSCLGGSPSPSPAQPNKAGAAHVPSGAGRSFRDGGAAVVGGGAGSVGRAQHLIGVPRR